MCAVVAVWTVIGLGICFAALRHRHQRRWNRRPYTVKDTLLLISAATLVAATLLYLVFTDSVLLYSRVAIMTIVIGGGAVLTYLLNRQHT